LLVFAEIAAKLQKRFNLLKSSFKFQIALRAVSSFKTSSYCEIDKFVNFSIRKSVNP